MTRRTRAGVDPQNVWQALAPGVQTGLERLVSDNEELVRVMLDAASDSDTKDLCYKCAGVMRQQNLSASAFLARFFEADILADHATLLGKSGKGGAAALAERIAGAWAKGPDFQSGTGGAAKANDEQAAGARVGKRARATTAGSQAPDDKFVLRFKTEDDDNELLEVFPTAAALADRVWELSEDRGLTLFDGEWDVEVDGGYGSDCCDAMVIVDNEEDSEEEWEDEGDFKKYVMQLKNNCYDAMVTVDNEEEWEEEGEFMAYVVEKLLDGNEVKITGSGDQVISMRPLGSDNAPQGARRPAPSKRKGRLVYSLEADLQSRGKVSLTFASRGALAEAAWRLCEDEDLEMPSADWWTMVEHGDTAYETTCYDAMMTSEDSEPEAAFQGFVLRRVGINWYSGPIKLECTGPGGGTITLCQKTV